MAGRGHTHTFHGAFNRKADAERKEGGRPGYWIKAVKIHGKQRWLVMNGSDNPGSGGRLRVKF